MKKFLFFEATEGSMEIHYILTAKALGVLPGWMTAECEHGDQCLVDWMKTARIGDFYNRHRLGCLVRVRVDGDRV